MLRYYFTFWHIYRGKNIDYVHVIISCTDDSELIKVFSKDDYCYLLKESRELDFTIEEIKKDPIFSALLRDGESLVKKTQKQQK